MNTQTLLFYCSVVIAKVATQADAFVPIHCFVRGADARAAQIKIQVPPLPPPPTSSSSSELKIGNFLDGILGSSDKQSSGGGPKTVVDLEATNVKVGPLKFFLQIYLVAEQNKPVKGSWVLNNNDENGSLDMYYKDGTGMFSIAMNEKMVQINRYGERPSLEYMLQESVMLHGVLDELNNIAFEVDDIEKEKRLLQLVNDDAINEARNTLPARKEG